MKIAILYICTGLYNQFFEGFYNSAERFLLKGKASLDYYVWSDDDNLAQGLERVHLHHKECEGFPTDSLFRFRMFLQVKEELLKYDYVYFFNANAEFRQPVDEEILPDESGLAAAVWPNKHAFLNHSFFYPYERDKRSLAYVPPFDGPYLYYMGGVNGGRSKEYMEMAEVLNQNIEDDYRRGIVAAVHDQAHLNRYLHHRACKVLPVELAWPEEWPAKSKPKMVFRDKKRLNVYFVKGRDRSFWGKVRYLMTEVRFAVSWYIYSQKEMN